MSKVEQWLDTLPLHSWLYDPCTLRRIPTPLPRLPPLPPQFQTAPANIVPYLPLVEQHQRVYIEKASDALELGQFMDALHRVQPGTMDVFMIGRYFGDHGQLSHLAVTVASENTSFLLDLVSLENYFFYHGSQVFRNILEGHQIKVCCFDAGRDAQALKRFGIRLEGVVDLKAFEEVPLFRMSYGESSERDKLQNSAGALVAELGARTLIQRPLPFSSKIRDFWLPFLLHDVAYMPHLYAFYLSRGAEFHGTRWRGIQIETLEVSEAHAAGRGGVANYPMDDWIFFESRFLTRTRTVQVFQPRHMLPSYR